jgi:hypothetical protein
MEGHNRRTCQQWSLIEAASRESEIIRNESARREMLQIHNDMPPYTPPITPDPHSPPPPPSRGGQGRVTRVVTISYQDTGPRIMRVNHVDNIERNLLREFDLATLDPPRAPPSKKKLVTQCQQPYEATDCGICMEELKNTNKFITRCGHQFCGCCMITHMRTQDFCPTCRGILI